LKIAYLRLGAIETEQGNYEKGIEYFEKVLEFDPKNVDAYSLMGRAQALMDQIKLSRKTYEKILNINHYDSYALCAVGNINLIYGRSDPNKPAVSFFILFFFIIQLLILVIHCLPIKLYILIFFFVVFVVILQKEAYYKRAVELFDKALILDNQNIYAANGIAIALAERGYVDIAKNLFIQVFKINKIK